MQSFWHDVDTAQALQTPSNCPALNGVSTLPQSLGGINIFILLSTTAFVYCAPLAYFMESHKWPAALEAAKASVGSQHLYFLMALSAVLYTVRAHILGTKCCVGPVATGHLFLRQSHWSDGRARAADAIL